MSDEKSLAVQDPTLLPSYSRRNRALRALWAVAYVLLYRTSPKPFHGWRIGLLRMFGARIGQKCHFHRTARIWAPWHLVCADRACVAEGVELYNPETLTMESHVTVSQGAYVCGATHLYNEAAFRLVSFPMRFGSYAWICARATVSPGVNVGTGAVLGLGSLATKDLDAFGVYAGVPARKVKERERTAVPAQYR